jgi:hypothetical protein
MIEAQLDAQHADLRRDLGYHADALREDLRREIAQHADALREELRGAVVYLYRAGNSVACKTGKMSPFHHHERGQRDGIPPLLLPVGAGGSALAVLHVACCLAQ